MELTDAKAPLSSKTLRGTKKATEVALKKRNIENEVLNELNEMICNRIGR